MNKGLAELTVQRFQRVYGEMTVADALAESEHYEKTYVALPVLDQARTRFWQKREDLLNYAAALDALETKEQQ